MAIKQLLPALPRLITVIMNKHLHITVAGVTALTVANY